MAWKIPKQYGWKKIKHSSIQRGKTIESYRNDETGDILQISFVDSTEVGKFYQVGVLYDDWKSIKSVGPLRIPNLTYAREVAFYYMSHP